MKLLEGLSYGHETQKRAKIYEPLRAKISRLAKVAPGILLCLGLLVGLDVVAALLGNSFVKREVGDFKFLVICSVTAIINMWMLKRVGDVVGAVWSGPGEDGPDRPQP